MTTARGSGFGGGGKGGGGGGSRVAQEAPNTLRSRATAKIVEALCEGPVKNLVNGERSIFFDNTALMAEDGTYNFHGVSYALVQGLPDQSPLPGITAQVTEIPVGVKVVTATPVIRSISNVEAHTARVTVRIPSLRSQNTSNGDLNPTTVQIAIDVRLGAGAWVEVVNDAISGKTESNYDRAYRIPLPEGAGSRDVRMRRITEDSVSAALLNDTYFSSLAEIIDRQMIYPDTASIGLAVDSSLFGGSIPSRAYDMDLLLIKVPSNYDPETRIYTGIWDGTFQIAWSNNSAWVLYDMLTNPRYGLGKRIPESAVDKWGLYDIGQYCDELVPDGFGDMEPRFTFNGLFAEREDAYRVLNAFASNFRGQIYWGAGTVIVVSDKPADPVALITAANVIDGRFSYSGTALKARHNRALVSWNDPDDGYRRAIEVVEDAEGIEAFGLRDAPIAAVGCTSRGQANRLGRWLIETEKHQDETVSWRASLDQFTLRPGDIVAQHDPTYAGIRRAGRCAAATASAVTIDSAVVITTGVAYELSVMLPTGEMETRAVTNAPGAASVIAVSPAFTEAPQVEAIWLILGTDLAPRQFRIVGLAEAEKHIIDVTALIHDPTKFDRIDLGLNLVSPPFTVYPTGQIERPTEIAVRKIIARIDNAIVNLVLVSWRASPDGRAARYEVEYQPEGIGWLPGGRTSGVSIDLPNLPSGIYAFRVRALDPIGGFSSWQTLSGVNTEMLLGVSDVQNLRLAILAEAATLSWDPVPDVGLSHYVIRHSTAQVGAEWASAILLVPITQETARSVPTMAGTYMVKAVATSGAESTNAATIVTAVTGDDDLNAVAVSIEQTTFPGTKTGCSVVSGGLEITPVSGAIPESATYLFLQTGGASVDLGASFTSRVSGLIAASGTQIDNNIHNWANIHDVPNIHGSANDMWSVEMEERHTDDAPAGAPAWTAWVPLVVSDITARAFQFRAILRSLAPNVTPRVTRLEAYVDMPDRIASERGLAVGTGGQAVAFDPLFKVPPAIVVTSRDLGNGERINVTSISTGGFTVQILNAAGAGVARTVDWVARGYGYER